MIDKEQILNEQDKEKIAPNSIFNWRAYVMQDMARIRKAVCEGQSGVLAAVCLLTNLPTEWKEEFSVEGLKRDYQQNLQKYQTECVRIKKAGLPRSRTKHLEAAILHEGQLFALRIHQITVDMLYRKRALFINDSRLAQLGFCEEPTADTGDYL